MTNEYLKIVEQMGKYKTVQNIMHHVNWNGNPFLDKTLLNIDFA